jgi:hypothetical protein
MISLLCPWVKETRPSAGGACGRENPPRLAGGGLVDHLAVDAAHASGVRSQDGTSPFDGFLSGGQSGIDRAEMARMKGGLGTEAESDRPSDCSFVPFRRSLWL